MSKPGSGSSVEILGSSSDQLAISSSSSDQDAPLGLGESSPWIDFPDQDGLEIDGFEVYGPQSLSQEEGSVEEGE